MLGTMYGEIAENFRVKIRTGELRPGDTLPTKGELMREYEVGPTTVDRVLRVLSDEGLISRRQGHRTVVRDPEHAARDDAAARRFVAYVAALQDSPAKTEVTVQDLIDKANQIMSASTGTTHRGPTRETVARLAMVVRTAMTDKGIGSVAALVALTDGELSNFPIHRLLRDHIAPANRTLDVLARVLDLDATELCRIRDGTTGRHAAAE